ncbi:MAG: hypothetical protein J0M15_04745 [Deltaproteobacteria bacterium]|jgi:hypothetical protein|nr:hypothetical protein [Deltaproteobacteria bacterium]
MKVDRVISRKIRIISNKLINKKLSCFFLNGILLKEKINKSLSKIILSIFVSLSVSAQNSTSTLTPSSGAGSSATSTSSVLSDTTVKNTGAVTITTLGRNVQDQSLNSVVGWSFAEFGIKSKFNEWFTFDFNLVGIFGEGAGQNYLSDEGASANTIIIDSIGVALKPIKQLELKAGVIRYKINPLLSTMSANTSLGSEQTLEFSNDSETMKLSFIGNEAMPSTGITKTSVDKENTPFFLAGTVKGELNSKIINTKLKGAVTQFKMGNLPRSQAKGALTGGNSRSSVTGLGDQMEYVIGFAGYETAGVIETDWTPNLTTSIKGVKIINNSAFEESNEGTRGIFEIKWKRGNVTLTPSWSVFNIQADTTPAPYSILPNRLNNREGQKISLSVDFEKQKLGFFGDYTKADVIVGSPYLTDREIFNLGVEVKYDLF